MRLLSQGQKEETMSALVCIAAQTLLVLCMIAAIVGGCSWLVWKFVYYVIAPKNPIGMTAVVSAVLIWCVSAAIIAIA